MQTARCILRVGIMFHVEGKVIIGINRKRQKIYKVLYILKQKPIHLYNFFYIQVNTKESDFPTLLLITSLR